MEQTIATCTSSPLSEINPMLHLPAVQREELFLNMVNHLCKQFGIEVDLSTLSLAAGQSEKPANEISLLYLEEKRRTAENVETERGQWNENTYNVESYYVLRFAKWAGDRAISKELIREYWKTLPQKDKIARHGGQKASLAKDTDPTIRRLASIYAHQKRLRAICTWAKSVGHIAENPFAGSNPVKLVSLPDQHRVVWNLNDIVDMLACTEPAIWLRKRERKTTRQQWMPGGPLEREALQARALVLALLDSAGRASEICQLNCGDIRRAKAVIKGKGGHENELLFVVETLVLLRELAGARPDDAPLVRDWQGNRCSKGSLLRIIKRLAERANVELPADPLHSFRHLAARLWVEGGMSALMIKAQLRHKNLRTTEIYTEQARDPIARAHDRHSPVPELLRRAGLLEQDLEQDPNS